MAGDDRVRHCQECNLNVYNLSEMTRAQAERLIAEREGRLCVRFYRRADGTMLMQDCPRRFQALVRRASRLAGAALSAIISVGFAVAQSVKQPEQTATNKDERAEIRLEVLDPTGATIHGARITLLSKASGKTTIVIADSDGRAYFPGLVPGSYILSASMAGFKSEQQEILANKAITLTMTLKVGAFQGPVHVEAPKLVPIESPNTDIVISPYPLQPLKEPKKRH
jgi:hypothetical protein